MTIWIRYKLSVYMTIKNLENFLSILFKQNYEIFHFSSNWKQQSNGRTFIEIYMTYFSYINQKENKTNKKRNKKTKKNTKNKQTKQRYKTKVG